ncbi:MAG: CAP domain-containing protein [Candidatus Eremiobacteraeota bacterium]|nr:CAP domain-containing protein [Candidatus Eremiobacteraeota bacterium]
MVIMHKFTSFIHLNKIHKFSPLIATVSFVIFFLMLTSVYLDEASADNDNKLRLMEKRVFELINKARVENGLSPLKFEEMAYKAALDHSRDMANRKYFSHTNPEGKGVLARIEKYGFSLVNRRIGENISKNMGYSDPASIAVSGWLKSPGHRKNIMTPKFKCAGVGIARGTDGAIYFTQVFWGDY